MNEGESVYLSYLLSWRGGGRMEEGVTVYPASDLGEWRFVCLSYLLYWSVGGRKGWRCLSILCLSILCLSTLPAIWGVI
jgi:hypothetical protein